MNFDRQTDERGGLNLREKKKKKKIEVFRKILIF